MLMLNAKSTEHGLIFGRSFTSVGQLTSIIYAFFAGYPIQSSPIYCVSPSWLYLQGRSINTILALLCAQIRICRTCF